jgi:carbon monoxide dehydrogenase subunit G
LIRFGSSFEAAADLVYLRPGVLTHTESIRIAKPAEVVWTLVGDPSAWPRWAGDLSEVRVHGDLAVGATVTYTYRGRSVAVTLTQYQHARLVEIAGSEKSYDMRESIALDADDTATKVSIAMGFEPTATWARLVAPLFAPFRGLVLGRSLRRSLHALRRATEDA